MKQSCGLLKTSFGGGVECLLLGLMNKELPLCGLLDSARGVGTVNVMLPSLMRWAVFKVCKASLGRPSAFECLVEGCTPQCFYHSSIWRVFAYSLSTLRCSKNGRGAVCLPQKGYL